MPAPTGRFNIIHNFSNATGNDLDALKQRVSDLIAKIANYQKYIDACKRASDWYHTNVYNATGTTACSGKTDCAWDACTNQTIPMWGELKEAGVTEGAPQRWKCSSAKPSWPAAGTMNSVYLRQTELEGLLSTAKADLTKAQADYQSALVVAGTYDPETIYATAQAKVKKYLGVTAVVIGAGVVIIGGYFGYKYLSKKTAKA